MAMSSGNLRKGSYKGILRNAESKNAPILTKPDLKVSTTLLKNANGSVKIIGPNDEEIFEEEITVARDGGWGWIIVISSFTSNLFVDGILFSFGMISKEIKTTIQDEGSDIAEAELAWVMSLLSSFYCLAGPVAAILANKYGFRVVATIGAGISSSAFSLTYLLSRSRVNIVSMYIVCGVLGGSGFCMLYTPSVLAVGFYFEKRRALATSICVCGAGVGQFVFGACTFQLLKTIGWRLTMVIDAGILLMCSICAATYRPLTPKITRDAASGVYLLGADSSWQSLLHQDGDNEKIIETKLGHSVLTFRDETGTLLVRTEANIEDINKPLARDDIYYRGSLKNIPEYAETVGAGHLSQHAWSAIVSRRSQTHENCCENFKSLKTFIDCSLLTNGSLLILYSSSFLTCVGFFAPFAFLIGAAKEVGIEESKGAMCLSIIGAANTIGRIVCGVLADTKKVHPLIMASIALLSAGVATASIPFFKFYWQFITFAVVYGFSIAFFVSLMTINLVELVGLSSLTSAFGLLTLFEGIAFLFGNPISGALFDATNSYHFPFWLNGFLTMVAGLLCFLAYVVNGRNKKRKN